MQGFRPSRRNIRKHPNPFTYLLIYLDLQGTWRLMPSPGLGGLSLGQLAGLLNPAGFSVFRLAVLHRGGAQLVRGLVVIAGKPPGLQVLDERCAVCDCEFFCGHGGFKGGATRWVAKAEF